MEVHEHITNWAWLVALIAGSNWVFGNRTTSGRELILRSGPFWRIFRWGGLAIFALAIAIQTLLDGHQGLATLALVGTFMMMVGTARKRIRQASPAHEKRTAEQDEDSKPDHVPS